MNLINLYCVITFLLDYKIYIFGFAGFILRDVREDFKLVIWLPWIWHAAVIQCDRHSLKDGGRLDGLECEEDIGSDAQ